MVTITPYDADGNAITSLTQWDYGVAIYLDGITEATSVHFSNVRKGVAYAAVGTYSDDAFSIKIPDVVLQAPTQVYGYVFVGDDDSGQATYQFEIPIIRRAKPLDYVESDNEDYVTVSNTLATATEAISSASEYVEAAAASATEAASSASSASTSAAEAASSASSASTSAAEAASSASSASTSATEAASSASEAASYAASAADTVEDITGDFVTYSGSAVGSSDNPVYVTDDGTATACDTPTSRAWFQGVPAVDSSGVMAVGKHIDFHTSNTSTSDYDMRISAGSSSLTCNGSLYPGTDDAYALGTDDLRWQVHASELNLNDDIDESAYECGISGGIPYIVLSGGGDRIYFPTHDMEEGLYYGRNLADVFSGEIANYSDAWEWIKDRINDGNYSDIFTCDYIPLETTDGYTFDMQIMGLNTYTGYGSTKVGNHIDFCSRTEHPTTTYFNSTNNNNGDADNANPFLASYLKQTFLDTVVYPTLPSEVTAQISDKHVSLGSRYSSSGTLTDDSASAWQTISGLWVPTEMEVTGHCGWGTQGYSHEGQIQYPYFVHMHNRLKDNPSGERCAWWLATARSGTSTYVCIVSAYGLTGTNFASSALRAPICFRIAAD